MKIRDVRKEKRGTRVRVSARVEWEDSPQPSLDLFYEADEPFGGEMSADPNAFLTACILPAMRHGERRVALEGPVCPRLAEGLFTAIELLRSWFGPPRREVRIEPAKGYRAPFPRRPGRSALFFTGGLDSLHLLRRNRIEYPRSHSESFQDALAVSGFLPDRLGAPGRNRSRIALSEIAAEAGVRLVAVETNLNRFETDLNFFAEEYIGAALCSAAHLFAGSLTSVSLASGRNVRLLVPRGTHPLLDPCFTSGALEVRHSGIHYSRIERLREICRWDLAVKNLVVCLQDAPASFLNCGRCEKCLRTMTALTALGRLADTREFPVLEVSAAAIESVSITPHVADYWRDLLEPLRKRGRDDLASAVLRKLEGADRAKKWFEEAGWKGALRKLDRRVLGGGALRLRRTLRKASAR
ncbi:MAG: hypothetical protein ACRD16_13790 [Thermoanaerobaculia bacterium]